MLYRASMDTPLVNTRALRALVSAEETLRKGSKSFDVAKLAFGREMRIGLVAIYAWCRVTVSVSAMLAQALADGVGQPDGR